MAENTDQTVDHQTDDTAQKDDVAALRAEMEQMKRDLAAARVESQSEKTARIQAEQRGMSASERALLAEEAACKSNIDAMNAEADGIENEIARLADEPGHGAEIAKLTRRLGAVTNKVEIESQRQQWLSGQREKVKAQAETISDPSNTLANGTNISDYPTIVRQWFKDHPKSFTDKAYLTKAIATAGYARDVEGLAENSPEYFAYIDERLEGAAPVQRAAPVVQAASDDDEGEELLPVVRNPQHRAAGPGSMAAVAPPSRNAATATSTGPRRQALLSKDEREAADGLFGHIPIKDRYLHYAERKEMMQKMRPGAFGGN